MHARIALAVLLCAASTPACLDAREGQAITGSPAPAPSHREFGFFDLQIVSHLPAGASVLCFAMRLVDADGQTVSTKGALRKHAETYLGQPACASGYGTAAGSFAFHDVGICEPGDPPNRLTVWVTDVQFEGVYAESEKRWTNPCPHLTEGASVETAEGGCEVEVRCDANRDVEVRFELDLRPGTPER